MARPPVLAAGVLLMCFVAAAVASPGPFLADVMGSSGVSQKVKPASDYHPDTEVATLQQTNIKSCRYTGCLDNGGCISSVVFQTDFTCNSKQQHYGHDDTIGQLGFSDKVGTCDWEISIYRWFDGPEFLPTPIFVDGGFALKFGTALGTCYLNSAAEQCDDPLCERMVIAVQGGLYFSRAYTPTQGLSDLPSPVETCAGDDPGEGTGLRIAKKDAAQKDDAAKKPKRVPRQTRMCEARGDCPTTGPVQELFDSIFDIGAETFGIDIGKPEPPILTPAAAPAQAQVAYNREPLEPSTPYYAGVALLISGPFTVTSKHGTKISETGLFEFTLASIGFGPAVTEATNAWPIVSGKLANIRFTREHQGYYGREGSA